MQSKKNITQWLVIVIFVIVLVCTLFLLPKKQSIYDSSSTETTTPVKSVEIATPVRTELSVEERTRYYQQQDKVQQAVSKYFKNAINRGLIVGAGVSIVKGDSVLLATGYGKRNTGTGEDVDGETVFRLGSLSKGFAGVLAGKFKSEGYLDWDDNVTEYLPELEFGKDYCAEDITLSHMLSHTTGAPYHSFTDRVEDGMSLERIANYFSSVKPISKPGKIYSYQNAMFAMTGEVTKSITCYDFETDLEQELFAPLQMTSTSTNHRSLLNTKNKAVSHLKTRRGWRTIRLNDRYYNAVAAGGINSNPKDMAQWMQFLLGHDEEIMSKDAIAEVFEPQIKQKGNKYYQRWKDHTATYYAYGWRVHKFFDLKDGPKTMIHHGGTVNNFRNEIALFPEEDLGVCVLMNSLTPLAKNVIPDLEKIIKDILDESPNQTDRIVSNM